MRANPFIAVAWQPSGRWISQFFLTAFLLTPRVISGENRRRNSPSSISKALPSWAIRPLPCSRWISLVRVSHAAGVRIPTNHFQPATVLRLGRVGRASQPPGGTLVGVVLVDPHRGIAESLADIDMDPGPVHVEGDLAIDGDLLLHHLQGQVVVDGEIALALPGLPLVEDTSGSGIRNSKI